MNYSNKSSGTGTATGVQLKDVLPTALTYVAGSCTPTCTVVGNTITWDLGSLAPGASGTKSYQATVSGTSTDGQTFTNAAEINSAQDESGTNFNDNKSSVTTTVRVPSISGSVLTDPNGDGIDQGDGSSLAGAQIKLFIDATSSGTVGSLDAGDAQVGSTVTTDSTGTWTFSGSGVIVGRTYFVTRTNAAGYASTNAIVGSGTASTATKISDDQIKIVLGALPTFSANNKFLAKIANSAPTCSNGSATTNEDTAVATTLSCSDPENDSLTYAIVSGPSHGTLSGTAQNLTYTPAANYNGSDSFTFKSNDGSLDSNESTYTINVTAVNDAPTASNLSAAESYTEDTPLNLVDIVVSDVDSATVTATLTLSNPGLGGLSTGTSGAVTSTYNSGTGVWSASGAIANVNSLLAGVVFIPAADVNSNFVIATSVSDGVAAAVTGSKAVTGIAVNDAPNAVNDSQTVAEDSGATTINVLGNDNTGPANESTQVLTISSVTQGANGSVAITHSGGDLTYTPNGNFNGSDSFTYTACDNGTTNSSPDPLCDTATVSVTVTAVNDAPTASNLSAAESYTEDTPLNLVDIVVSDVDSATVTATLTLSNPGLGGLSTGTSGAVTSTYNSGTGVWSASGAIANVNSLLAGVVFIPAADVNSNFVIATSVSDGVAAAVTGSKAVTGIAVNDAPNAVNDSQTVAEDSGATTINVLGNDNTGPANESTQVLTISSVTQGANGSVAITHSGGDLTYTPNGNFNGSDSFTYTACDNGTTNSSPDPLCDTATVSITVTAVNDAPTASNLSAAESYTEDTPLNLVDIVVSDVDSATVTATLTLSNPGLGGLSTGTSGAVTSTYNSGTGVWSASGAIANVNSLLAGVVFIPAADVNSNFVIATSVSDGVAAAVTGSKAVTGIAVNDAPNAVNDSQTVAEDSGATTINVLGNDNTGPANESTQVLTISSVTQGANGSVAITHSGGDLTYTPNGNFNGSDSFTYTACDNGTTNSSPDPLCDTATVVDHGDGGE